VDNDTTTPPHGSPLDLLYRLAYRTAYRLLRPWWRLRRPRVSGAGVAIWCDGRVLVVRTSYRGDLLDLPGGGVGRGETAEAAAVRELREEVGIAVPAGALRPGGVFELVLDGRRITDTVFEWSPDALPVPRIDRREIVWAGWLTREELAGRPLAAGLAAYLDQGIGAGEGTRIMVWGNGRTSTPPSKPTG
jgi:8-oxo-dGTP pyrophosphatase MutT (NUDIX family)